MPRTGRSPWRTRSHSALTGWSMRSADVFSLGLIYLNIATVLSSCPDERLPGGVEVAVPARTAPTTAAPRSTPAPQPPLSEHRGRPKKLTTQQSKAEEASRFDGKGRFKLNAWTGQASDRR